MWPIGSIKKENPSIEFLELFAVAAGILTWQDQLGLTDTKICLHCDNIAVVHMINNMSSSCHRCMILLQMLALNGLFWNRRLLAVYINTKDNDLADMLSRNQMSRFRRLGPDMNLHPDLISSELWPLHQVWRNSTYPATC